MEKYQEGPLLKPSRTESASQAPVAVWPKLALWSESTEFRELGPPSWAQIHVLFSENGPDSDTVASLMMLSDTLLQLYIEGSSLLWPVLAGKETKEYRYIYVYIYILYR